MAYTYLAPYSRGGAVPSRQGGSLFDLHRQMNRMFDDLFEQGDSNGDAGSTGWPMLDIHQTENAIEIRAELAGVEEDDIDIDVEDGLLTLSGEKRSEREDENDYSERTFGRFQRRITLPKNIDQERIEASFENGLLTITLPRAEEQSRGRKIKLGSGKGGSGNKTIEGSSSSGEKKKDKENSKG